MRIGAPDFTIKTDSQRSSLTLYTSVPKLVNMRIMQTPEQCFSFLNVTHKYRKSFRKTLMPSLELLQLFPPHLRNAT